MTSEEKVLEELKEKIRELVSKTSELKVTEDERRAFEYEKSTFQSRLDDYKAHKKALEERERQWNLSHPSHTGYTQVR